jgi:hypothetical protein
LKLFPKEKYIGKETSYGGKSIVSMIFFISLWIFILSVYLSPGVEEDLFFREREKDFHLITLSTVIGF